MEKVAVLPLLLIQVLTLHLPHFQSTPITYYNSTNYLTALEARQAQLQSDLQSIQNQISSINETLRNSSLVPNQRLSTLSEGIADERDSLYNIETYINLPFEIEPCYPINLSDTQRAQLQQQINNVNQSLINLQSQTTSCLNCSQVTEIQTQIKQNSNYLNSISATVNSGCLPRPF
jgi:peptidoglycan hydrolase CwlO-like protein